MVTTNHTRYPESLPVRQERLPMLYEPEEEDLPVWVDAIEAEPYSMTDRGRERVTLYRDQIAYFNFWLQDLEIRVREWEAREDDANGPNGTPEAQVEAAREGQKLKDEIVRRNEKVREVARNVQAQLHSLRNPG